MRDKRREAAAERGVDDRNAGIATVQQGVTLKHE